MVVAVLRSFPLLKLASDATLEQLAALCVVKRFEFGEALWREGDASTQASFVRIGLIQVLRRMANGDENTLALFGPREVVGLTAALDGFRFPADAVVASDAAEVIQIPSTALKQAVETDHAIALSANRTLIKQTVLLRQKVEVLTAGEVPQRIAVLLLNLWERFGDEMEDGSHVLPIPLTRRTLARLIGARPETVIRVMTRWTREGVVENTDDGMVLKRIDELQALATG